MNFMTAGLDCKCDPLTSGIDSFCNTSSDHESLGVDFLETISKLKENAALSNCGLIYFDSRLLTWIFVDFWACKRRKGGKEREEDRLVTEVKSINKG